MNASIPMTLEGAMRDLYADSLARTSFTLVMLAVTRHVRDLLNAKRSH